ncbi:MAG: TolC family protein [Vicinamibacterales bacterium]
MRFHLPLFLAAGLLAAAPVGASAQSVLTLDEATAQAVGGNRALGAARSAAREAASRADEARSAFFPRVSVIESWQRGNNPVFVFSSLLSARQFGAQNFAIDALNHPVATGFFHGAVAVDQVLFDGGRTRGGADLAAQARVMAEAGRDEQALALTVDVARAYGRVLRADAESAAAAAAVAAAQEDVARAERRRDAGTVTEADVLSITVHLAAMRQRAIQAGGEAAIARSELNRLRGVAIDTDFSVQEPAPPGVGALPSWPALVAEAEAGRPEFKRAAAAVGMADAGRRQARAAWWPQVAAQAAYQYDGLTFSERASAWTVGGEVRWSFATGGAAKASVRAAAEAAERARLTQEEARAAVHVELRSATSRLESATAREAVARATVAQARESQRIVRDRYDAGMTGVSDVLRAATAVLDAETLRLAALVDRIEAQAALNRALGRRP